MRSRLRTAAGLPGPWILWLVFVVAIQGAAAWCSESVVRDALDGRGPGWLVRFALARADRTPPALHREIASDLRGLQLCATALFALYLVVRLHLFVRVRPKLLPASLLAWWLAVELLVAPYLRYRAWNLNYLMVRQLDHRPTEVGGRFNSDSVIATEESSAFLPEDLNVVFLGDSFTMGYLAGSYDAFPAIVGRAIARENPEARVHVANFGWVSSSPFLSLRRLVDIGEKYAPDLVVMNVDMTDFADDLRYERVLGRRGVYWLYDKIPLTIRMLQALAPSTFRRVAAWSVGDMPSQRYFITEEPLEQTREWMRPLERNCDSIAAWCREHGARFVLVMLPRSYQYDEREVPRKKDPAEYTVLGPNAFEPFRFLDELRPTKPYPVVSLLADFQANTEFPTCFEDDPHWNETGHRVAARALERVLAPIVADILRDGAGDHDPAGASDDR